MSVGECFVNDSFNLKEVQILAFPPPAIVNDVLLETDQNVYSVCKNSIIFTQSL